MIKKFTTLLFLFISLHSFGQSKVEWKEGTKLSLDDFQGQAPAAGASQNYYLAATLDFAYAMTNAEFMLTKNFNRNVSVYYNPAISWIQDGENTAQLLKYAQMDFDLMELYARKLRKRIYDAKGAFSNYNFYQQAQEEVHADMVKRQSEMYATTYFDDEEMEAYHRQILNEMAELNEFCKECKPAKKQKKKKAE
ncbi:MAG: hypothetical protein LPK07_04860 [Hymenobacteraceae bacterium]|nr:hypothetical protein [Hymenobacteraceae bacterium]